MRHYLLYSSYAHVALLAALMIASRNSLNLVKKEAYYIDFIGPSKVVTMEKAALEEGKSGQDKLPADKASAAKAAAAKTAPKAPEEEDDFSSGALPKPSVLSGGGKLFEPAPAKAGGEGGTPIVTDSANFPYPWYITQVREQLWNAWTSRMPSAGGLRCTVRFSIQRDGTARAVSVEKSSGNRLFDSAAEGTVENAGPFPALPDDFFEDKLTVHVEFKAME